MASPDFEAEAARYAPPSLQMLKKGAAAQDGQIYVRKQVSEMRCAHGLPRAVLHVSS